LGSAIHNAKSWDEIFHALKGNPNSGKLFEEFCKFYFLAEPSVKNDYKHVWLFSETPIPLKKRLNLAQVDHGVDLVLEEKSGELSVVQCKFRGDQNSFLSWSKDKITNLFAEGDKADKLIVFTNASGLDKHSFKKGADKFKLLTVGDLLAITPQTIQSIVCLLEKKNPKIIPKAMPRPYQRKAIESIVSGFENFDRGQLILPCGAGKTLLALWVKEALKPRKTIVLVPSLALLRQVKHEWNQHQKKWSNYLCVCSEKDITKDDLKDIPVVHTYEIDGPVTTDPKQIKKFLNKSEDLIIYSTYQSLSEISKAIEGTKILFDLSICDEAHKTAGSKLNEFGLIHDNRRVPVKKRLYMTATPKIISERLRSRLDEDQIKYLADMSDENIFGPEFYRMSFKEAIDRKILVDYQIIAMGVSDEELKKHIADRTFVDSQSTIEDVANNYALEKVMVKYGATHAITFHASILRASRFKDRHLKIYPEIPTEHVSGEQSTNFRNILMNEFKTAPNAVMTNARCLTEGIDVPAIDLVYFCDPKNSKIDIIQASGRALRKSKNKDKKYGYVVVPIFHRAKEQIEETIEASAFKNLISVVRALCDQDERLQVEINSIKFGGVQRQTNSSHLKIDADSTKFIVLENFQKKLKKSIFEQIVEKIRDSWKSRYELLVEFRKQHSDRWPNQLEEFQGVKLGTWCANQRHPGRKAFLTPERKALLRKIDFPWEDNRWEKGFEALKAFRSKSPNRWPNSSKSKFQGVSVSAWVNHQRVLHQEKKLSKEKIKLLESIGFEWLNQREVLWNERYAQLNRFRKKFPKMWPTQSTVFEGYRLATWVQQQRTWFKLEEMSKDRISLLNKIGFSWKNPDPWPSSYLYLVKYRKTHSDKWPSNHEKFYGFNLGIWCRSQLQLYRLKRLSLEKINKLTKIGFPLERNKESDWLKNYSLLKDYRNKFPDKWPTGNDTFGKVNISNWCRVQRVLYRKKKIKSSRKTLLDKIGFRWITVDTWPQYYSSLKEFRKKYPNSWPKSQELYKGMILGNWCNTQRQYLKKGRLLQGRQKLLEKMEFPWDMETWPEIFEKLKRYKKGNPNKWPGNNETVDGINLGRWCYKQRSRFKNGKLSKKRMKLLTSIGFS